MPTLITYTEGQYQALKAGIENKGGVLISAAALLNTDEVNELKQQGGVVVDVSTLLPLFAQNDGIDSMCFRLELLCNQLGDNAMFVSDQTVAEKHSYDGRTLFGAIENCGLAVAKPATGTIASDSVRRITELDDNELTHVLAAFEEKLIGQPTFKEALRGEIESFRLFNGIGEQPILSLLLIGPSGVGKTETARILCELLAPGQPLPKINFGNYSSMNSLNSLIGSPRGYIGSEEGELTMKLKSSGARILLIDEFEKADPAVWNFFLELLETGEYTDSQGTKHDLNGYVLIFTSNEPRSTVHDKFPAELMSRFNLKVNFNHLETAEKELFAESYISKIANKYIMATGVPEKAEDIASKALEEIQVDEIDNIRVLKHESRKMVCRARCAHLSHRGESCLTLIRCPKPRAD